jgi:UDP-N-acetylglucosamine pyrophosphorylase
LSPRYFNTNNLWVNLPMLKETLDRSNGVLPLPLIKNKKTVNPRDSSTEPVFQLETAMGSGESGGGGLGVMCGQAIA